MESPLQHQSLLFVRMFLGGRRVLMTVLAMLVSSLGVVLRVFVLAHIMEVGRLEVMMGRRLMMSRRLMMMFARRMLVLRHDVALFWFSGSPVQPQLR